MSFSVFHLFYGFDNLVNNVICSVRAGELADVGAHLRLQRFVVFQAEQRRDEILRRVGGAHHDGGFGVDELLGVFGLVVFGGGGQRHEDDGLLHQGQLRN